jgi:pSer/pThr/pTyr-binding forkhead associated (FHA) protein
MAEITLRCIDGADRGRVFENAPTPLTIGREEGNTIQLNDERISRFHIKIQEDQSKLILTDLDSTNGTKVNGEDVQLRVLRYGDVITLGRSVLLVGSADQIAERLRELRGEAEQREGNGEPVAAANLGADWDNDADVQQTLHAVRPPELPDAMSPGQRAQLSELLEYIHVILRELFRTVRIKGEPERITLALSKWQDLLALQDLLAGYLRKIGEPDGKDEE